MTPTKYLTYVFLLCIFQSIFCAFAFVYSSIWMAAVGILTVLSYWIGRQSIIKDKKENNK